MGEPTTSNATDGVEQSQPSEATPSVMRAMAMRMAVQSGVPEAIGALLDGMDEVDAVEALTTPYSTSLPDDMGTSDPGALVATTHPIIHAARAGSAAVFCAVLTAMRRWLPEEEQVKEFLAMRDEQGCTALSMAARSGSDETFETVLDEMTKELAREELSSLLRSCDREDRSLLAHAARSGWKATFETVLAVLRTELPQSEIEETLIHMDRVGMSLFASAAIGGNADCINSVITVLREALPEDEIKKMLSTRDLYGRSVLALAACSGDTEGLATVLSVLRAELPSHEVRDIIGGTDVMSRSLLAQAAAGGKGTMKAARTLVHTELTEDEERAAQGFARCVGRMNGRARLPTDPYARKLSEYRGISKWEGLFPPEEEPREWDEGFRSFLVKYGMITHMGYDVYVKPLGVEEDERGYKGTSRFKDNLDAFTKKGLRFSYVNREGIIKDEYDFSNEYHVIGNLVCTPSLRMRTEDNWFGFVMLSNDLKEMVVIFRGTQSLLEWVMNATIYQEVLHGEPKRSRINHFFRKNLLCHAGFQQLYVERSTADVESPRETIHRLIKEHKETLEFVTTVGHSLGGGMCQLCAVDLVHSGVLDDVPVLAIGWGAPKVGNLTLSKWADSMHPQLRILRVKTSTDLVAKIPPSIPEHLGGGGYRHLGSALKLSNEHLVRQKLIKKDATNDANHNLQAYLHNIDPRRDVALINKYGDILDPDYRDRHHISAMWHKLSYPRTVYDA